MTDASAPTWRHLRALQHKIDELRQQRAFLRRALRDMLNNQPDDPEYATEAEWTRWHRTEQRAMVALQRTAGKNR